MRMCIAKGVGCQCDVCRSNLSWRQEIVKEYAAAGGKVVTQQDKWEHADVIWKVSEWVGGRRGVRQCGECA